jgi:hypothetical protein
MFASRYRARDGTLDAQASAASSTLSREHTVVVVIPEMQLEAGFRRLSDRWRWMNSRED